MTRAGARWRDGLLWAALGYLALVLLMPQTKALFALLFPGLDRPLYEQDSFLSLVAGHLALVAASSLAALGIALPAGIFVTRASGADFRGIAESLAAMGQSFPPVAVLALAVPLTGFGSGPALIALTLYGALPILQNTISGLGAVPDSVREAARGVGMAGGQLLLRVELPLAAPIIIAGIRTSVVINIATATIASTVGARTLGSPILIGLNGANIAYVVQGAVLVALLGVLIDLAFERLVGTRPRCAGWR